ncbi:zinc-dependent metalloprotease [Aeromicrobium sp. CF4.19]|uniref:zinc-dependent metalloprotease n=1 Tax=Aeromicrobium sp. CF4.19 TaxID=3373082 RepID=UPI003EE5E848
MPDDRNPDEPDPRENPFAGTPMEPLFNAMGGPSGQAPDLSALFGQMQQMFSGAQDGSVSFDVVRETARKALAATADPTPHAGQQGAVADAVQLAETWLDRATDLPPGATTSAAWSRAEWVEATAGTWQQLIEPIADSVVGAMGEAIPDEARAMAGPLIGMLNQAGSAMFAQQVGQALAALAAEVVSSTDVGIPLTANPVAAVLPQNVEAFGDGLEHSPADVLLYVTLRECAHHRLFAHASWLRSALVSTIEEYGRGTRIDLSAIESQVRDLDPSRPEQIAEAMQGGMFEPERTPEQQVALDRLETLLAFIEGWVDDVVAEATRETMPAAAALAEAVRRRRATGGPAEQTFASLVGLELRPRRMRDATTLWAALRDRKGPEARDAVWSHPDLMPTRADLDDPLGFSSDEATTPADPDFDAALDELLSEGDSSAATEEPDEDGSTPDADR